MTDMTADQVRQHFMKDMSDIEEIVLDALGQAEDLFLSSTAQDILYQILNIANTGCGGCGRHKEHGEDCALNCGHRIDDELFGGGYVPAEKVAEGAPEGMQPAREILHDVEDSQPCHTLPLHVDPTIHSGEQVDCPNPECRKVVAQFSRPIEWKVYNPRRGGRREMELELKEKYPNLLCVHVHGACGPFGRLR